MTSGYEYLYELSISNVTIDVVHTLTTTIFHNHCSRTRNVYHTYYSKTLDVFHTKNNRCFYTKSIGIFHTFNNQNSAKTFKKVSGRASLDDVT